MNPKTQHLELELKEVKLILAALASEHAILDQDIVGHLNSAPAISNLIVKIENQLI